MNEKRDRDFAAAFAELRAEYAVSLPSEVEELVFAVKAARRDQGSAPRMRAARSMAHKLCGTAGSYGFSEISEVSAKLEVILNAIEHNESPPLFSWTEIESLLERITAALADIGKESSPLP